MYCTQVTLTIGDLRLPLVSSDRDRKLAFAHEQLLPHGERIVLPSLAPDETPDLMPAS